MIKKKTQAKYPNYVYLILSKDEEYWSAIYYKRPLWRKGACVYIKRFFSLHEPNCFKRDIHFDYGYNEIENINSELRQEARDLYQFKNMRECLKFVRNLRLLEKLAR